MDNDEATKKIRAAAESGNITYASQEGVESFPQPFTDEFLSEICEVNGGAWISDESGLWDFVGTDGLTEARAKIAAKYGVDVGDKEKLLDIFRMIHAQNRTPQ